MKRFIIILALFQAVCLGICAQGQEEQDDKEPVVKVGLAYTGELQTDFDKGFNFVNLLRLNGSVRLGRSLKIHVSTLSTAKTREESLLHDLQTYSNIEVENIPLALSIAGMEWKINEENTLFFGIHNMNEDFFVSDVTSLFTNSSCGIYPTLGCNYPIANYPLASVGLHYKYETERVGALAAVYNGKGYNRFTGRENVFRFCPQSDGVFGLVQGEYKWKGSSYFLGGSIHYDPKGLLYEEETVVDAHKVHATLWTYGEQRVTNQLSLIAGYSHAFDKNVPCSDFVGVGGKYNFGQAELGLFTDYAHFREANEWATELTCKVKLNPNVFLQPALHVIRTGAEWGTVGMIRVGVEY